MKEVTLSECSIVDTSYEIFPSNFNKQSAFEYIRSRHKKQTSF